MLIKVIISLITVFLFLLMLVYFDSLKLTSTRLLLACLAWGIVSACLSFFLNTLSYRAIRTMWQSGTGNCMDPMALNYGKLTTEINFKPIRFKRLGMKGLYSTYARFYRVRNGDDDQYSQ
jgi:hypothetical protein